MASLNIHAGPRALAVLRERGLRAADVRAIAAAAGGPKGLAFIPLDRFLFGQWLQGPGPSVHLAGASIGAWRLACALRPDADRALQRLAEDYITASRAPPDGGHQTASAVSARFADLLQEHFGDREAEMLAHPRLRLHVVTAHGRRGLLRREHRIGTVLGYLGAYASNALHRRLLGLWLERLLFSDPREPLPLPLQDFPTRRVALTPANLQAAIQASGSIPFWLRAVHDIADAPPGACWDGGITDYHLYWPWHQLPVHEEPTPGSAGLVLYPHFSTRLIPGWLDKAWQRRHGTSHWLDNMVLLCPDPDWVATLPGGQLPDRRDLKALPNDVREQRWRRAVAESERLAEDWADWLARGCPIDQVRPLVVHRSA